MTLSPKILPVRTAAKAVRDAQSAGEVVVMCHGCFDIVHPGHVRHLQHAAKQGDRLIVSITGDAVLNKGTGRPLIPQELRAENLAALDCVDWVTINSEPTAVELLDVIQPDVYVKGREYEHNRDPRFLEEREVVERNGGRVVFTSGDVIFSSTALIAALEESAHPFHVTLRKLVADHNIDAAAIESLLSAFAGERVCVIGEVIKDTYVMCDRPEVAGEGAMMTLRPLEHRSFDGGAAIICLHLAAMGARPTLVTGLPRTPESEAIRQRLEIAGVDVRAIHLDQPMVEKRRFLVGTTKVMKLDLGEALTIDANQQQELIDAADEASRGCGAAIVADFGQGMLSSATLRQLCSRLRANVAVLAGDVSGKRSRLMSLQHMDLLCPSEQELREAVHDFDGGLSSVVAHVLQQTKSANAIITLGADGAIAFARPHRDGRHTGGTTQRGERLIAEHMPAFTPHAIDALGCGDALLAAATMTLATGGSLAMATIIGNIAAAAQANKLGNAVIGAMDLRRGAARLAAAQLNYEPQQLTPAARF